jgi:hypothetical protein
MNKFASALKLLADANVKFVVIGGFAAMLQGSVILAQDLDISYERTPENLKRLAAALASIHLVCADCRTKSDSHWMNALWRTA